MNTTQPFSSTSTNQSRSAHSARPRILSITGDGKGKTTSAAGMCLRMLAKGRKVLVVQFVKNRESGEMELLRALGARIERSGRGFVPGRGSAAWIGHREAAREGLLFATAAVGGGSWDLVVLDEIGAAIGHGLVECAEVEDLARAAKPGSVLVLTGRGLPDSVLDLCDTVSRIECVKHGYQIGIPAQEGVEL